MGEHGFAPQGVPIFRRVDGHRLAGVSPVGGREGQRVLIALGVRIRVDRDVRVAGLEGDGHRHVGVRGVRQPDSVRSVLAAFQAVDRLLDEGAADPSWEFLVEQELRLGDAVVAPAGGAVLHLTEPGVVVCVCVGGRGYPYRLRFVPVGVREGQRVLVAGGDQVRIDAEAAGGGTDQAFADRHGDVRRRPARELDGVVLRPSFVELPKLTRCPAGPGQRDVLRRRRRGHGEPRQPGNQCQEHPDHDESGGVGHGRRTFRVSARRCHANVRTGFRRRVLRAGVKSGRSA